MKRFFTPLLLVSVISLMLAGCKGCGGGPENGGTNRVAKGKVKYGGMFRMNEVEDFRSLYPLNVIDQPSIHIAQQVYEGLVKLDQRDLSPRPCLASSWDVLDSATRFVFHLRQHVVFHDNPCFADGKGREMTAQDVKYCFDRLCTFDEHGTNQQFLYTFKDRVKGANELYDATRNKKKIEGGVSGVKVVNDSTIEIQLLHPFAGFLNVLSMPGCWIYAHEAYEKYGEDMRIKCVGTGPFQLKTAKEGEVVILEYNPGYWDFDADGNRLPYLNGVRCEFIKDRHSELLAFKNGDLEIMFRLPVEMVGEIMGDTMKAKAGASNWDLQSVTAMSLTFYGFQHMTKPFDNVKLRQALNYAIDRRKIAVNVLQGDAVAAEYGVVPPSIANYNAESIKGYQYDVETAKRLLAEAGYPGGKGLPVISLSINNGGNDRNMKVAEAVKNMLKENIGVEVSIDPLPLGQQLQALQAGQSSFFKVSWNADYPDPETFLTLFYGKHVPETMSEPSYTNTTRYKSARFDSIFEASLREADPVKRMELYRMADQEMLSDAAIMPIYYEINDRLVQKYVRGLEINAMEYRDLTRVWLDVTDKATVEGAKKEGEEKH